ncbi:hypothetical protein F4561_006133 [Lipingzhangella halophila]|uniref:DUF6286 domain-containing protein n=1 Tax=Lipingzhangella halophila TaxID=1783352 RepID=A0A7W7RNI1_9ACTN|nr:DUF6286 domain-containing protein [Lipingzhangella halophila]MBB4935239.1 hypothetical protein [Lipingzhangella halophila]
MTTVEEAGAAERRSGPSAETRARRSAIRTFRPSRSWPALLAGLVLLAGAVLIAAEIVSTLVGSPLGIIPVGAIVPVLSGTGWNHPAVLGVSGALVLLGLILLVAALIPGRGGYLPLRTGDPALAVGLSRAGMRSALATAAREVDGVEGARVSVGRRRVRVRANTHLRAADGLREAVGDAVRERLAELAPLRPLRIRTRIKLAKA